jgi:hypothetical protein
MAELVAVFGAIELSRASVLLADSGAASRAEEVIRFFGLILKFVFALVVLAAVLGAALLIIALLRMSLDSIGLRGFSAGMLAGAIAVISGFIIGNRVVEGAGAGVIVVLIVGGICTGWWR